MSTKKEQSMYISNIDYNEEIRQHKILNCLKIR